MARQPQPSDNPIFLTLAARSVLLDSFLSFLLLYFALCGAASHGRRAVEFIHSSKLPSLPIGNKSKHGTCKQASSYNGYIPGNKVQNALLLPCFPFELFLMPYSAITIDLLLTYRISYTIIDASIICCHKHTYNTF